MVGSQIKMPSAENSSLIQQRGYRQFLQITYFLKLFNVIIFIYTFTKHACTQAHTHLHICTHSHTATATHTHTHTTEDFCGRIIR